LRGGAGGRLKASKPEQIFICLFSPNVKIPATRRASCVGAQDHRRYTPKCLERAMALYSHAIKTLVPVFILSRGRGDETLENIFRSVNIALVNELKIVSRDGH